MDWRKTQIVARREFAERAIKPGYWVATLLGVVFMVALFIGPSVIHKLSHPTVTVGSIGISAPQLQTVYRQIPHHRPLRVKIEPTFSKAAHLVKSGHLQGFFTKRGARVYYYGSPGTGTGALIAGIDRFALFRHLQPQILHKVLQVEAHSAVVVVAMAPSTASIVRSASIYALGLVLFLLVMMYGVFIGLSVVEEKETRHAEMILAHINPNALLAGKILGFGGLAFLQLLIWGLAGVLSYLIHGHHAQLYALPMGDMGLFTLWAVIGYGQYATLFAAMASRASRTAEMNQATMPVTLIVMVGYMGSILASTQPVGILATILHVTAFVPFLAPIMAFAMLQSGGLPWWQILLDVLLQLAVLWWALSYAAHIFRRHLLTYHPLAKLKRRRV